MSIESVLAEVAQERARQDAMAYSSADASHSADDWLAILGIQIGYVCEEAYCGTGAGLRKELVQVAAVCQAWAEADEPHLCLPAWWDMARRYVYRHEGRLAWLMRALGVVGTDIAQDDGVVRHSLARVAGLAVAWAASLDPAKEATRSDG